MTDERIYTVQNLKEVHTDYPFYTMCSDNRVYSSSLTQKISALEFNAEF